MSDADNTVEQTTTETPEAPDAPALAVDTEDALGDAGRRAITAEREARRRAEDELKELRALMERDGDGPVAKAVKQARDYQAKLAIAQEKLKKIEDANLSEIDKAKRDAEEARTQLATLQRESARARIALEKGVPSDLIEFIVGEDEEQMAAKADLLMSRLNSTPSTPKPDFTQGASGTPAPATRPGADTFAAGVRL